MADMAERQSRRVGRLKTAVLVAHGLHAGMVLLCAVTFFFLGSILGEEEQYTFFRGAYGRGTVLGFIYFFMKVNTLLLLAFAPLQQLPFLVLFWIKSSKRKMRKLYISTLPIALSALYYLELSELRLTIDNENASSLFVLSFFLITGYLMPWLLITWTWPDIRKQRAYRFYKSWIQLQLPVYFFLFLYIPGLFPELQRSLSRFLDSYSMWK